MTLDIGALLINRYRIHRILAHGGMGSIYFGLDESLGVEVAVKENLFSNPEFSRQFHREATILAALRHPNLPRVTDHFVIEGQGQYLVMDFIEGEDLRQRMTRTGGISETEALLIGIAICNALDYLHSRQPPILHRDIKPGNIKITLRGQIYLVDFGLAKIVHSGQATTIGAQSLTPGYAPPEQYGQGTDSRSDIYSLAATLYAAMTNSLPEDGLARAIGSANLTPLRQRRQQVSDRLAMVIERGMAVSPEARFQTANEFKIALMGANTQIRQKIEGVDEIILEPSSAPPVQLTSQPTQYPAEQPPYQPDQKPSTHPPAGGSTGKMPRWLVPAGGVFGILILAALGIVLFPGIFPPAYHPQVPSPALTSPVPRTPAATVPAVLHLPSPTSPGSAVPATLTPSPIPTTEPAATPTQEIIPTPIGGGSGQIVFSSNRTGTYQLFIMDQDGKILRQVTNLPDGACQPDWSPDGKRLVFVSPCRKDQDQYKGSALFLINLDGTGVVPLRTTPGGDFEPAWSPDSQVIAFTSIREGRPHIFLYHLADQSVVNLSRPSSLDRQAAWSPDGKTIAFTTLRSDHYQVFLMDSNGQNARPFSSFKAGPSQFPTWSPDGQVIVFSHSESVPWLVARRLDDKINEFPVSEIVRPARNPSYSPDGGWIVFTSILDGNPEIYRMTPNGIGLTRLTNDAASDIDPSWFKK
ncbi:MAG TPA: protein kinase [Anaerolineaceae bacterium]|nr:protein kinase [Anaerolineaceae bacterium]